MNQDLLLQQGLDHHRQGRLAAARQCYERLLQALPGNGPASHLLGLIAHQEGRHEAAVAFSRTAAERMPADPAPLANLGAALMALGRTAAAVAAFRRALVLDPALGFAIYWLGHQLAAAAAADPAAAVWLARAVRLMPGHLEAVYNLGLSHWHRRQFDRAERCWRRAVVLAPEHFESWNNLGSLQAKTGRPSEPLFHRAGVLRPDDDVVAWHLGLLALARGDMPAGWVPYERRLGHAELAPMPPLPGPKWQGQPLPGGTLLIHAEQGMGDTLQFVRLAALAAPRVGRVVLVAQKPIVPLMAGVAGVAAVVPWGVPLPAYDAWIPLLSLPGLFRLTLDSIPAAVPYLQADPVRVAAWRQRLGPGFKVGLVWQGNAQKYNDFSRSAPLRRLAALFTVPGVRWFSLQVGDAVADIAAAGLERVLTDLSPGFEDTAAILQVLDLCLSIDTSVLHLAGALGRPTWALLPWVAEWRWLLDRDDSPWYPTLRLYRQPAHDDWEALAARVAADLAALVDAGGAHR